MSDKNNTNPAVEVGTAEDVEKLMRKYDKESNTRIWEGKPAIAVRAVMVLFSLYCIYSTLFSVAALEIRLTAFLALVVIMGYLTYPASKKHVRHNYIPWYDVVLMVVGAACFLYFCFGYDAIIAKLTSASRIKPFQIAIGIVGILILMELCRRCVGLPILCVVGALLIYTFSTGLSIKRLMYTLFYTTSGVLGTPVQVCAKYIVVFIIFGAFLERTGIAAFFIDVANALVGGFSGGPAKVAVISSALCGMVSGSSVGNTVTTGSVTIPMMKKTGYKPEFAGAVEAAASTGGQIMPPIMGAAAFLMADYVSVPYSNIIVRAILPAVLYFLGIFICVHLEAKKLGLTGIPKEELPIFKKLIKRTYLLLPLIILVYLVSTGSRTMAFSAAIAIIFAIAVSNLDRKPAVGVVGCAALLAFILIPSLPTAVGIGLLAITIICCVICMFSEGATLSKEVLFDALANGGKSSISVAAACCAAGIISGCITMTGLASQIISAVIRISGGHLFIALFLTMICCIILGMGVPTTANYCIMASTCAPILIKLGVPAMAAHFFVFYFGIVADITPPVALAAYAGSAIAGSNPMKTAVNATKLAIAAFIVPYMFALNPAMLFIDTNALEVIQIIITAVIGLFGVTTGLEGFFKGNVAWPLRIISCVGGLCLIYPELLTDVIGIVLVAAVIAFQIIRSKKVKTA